MAALLMERLITQLELNDIDRGVRQEYILEMLCELDVDDAGFAAIRIPEALDTIAAVSAASEDGERVATIAGAAAVIREAIAAQPAPFDVAITSPLLQQIKASVSRRRWHRTGIKTRPWPGGSGGIRAGELCKVSTGLR
jgi:hypothetical protein